MKNNLNIKLSHIHAHKRTKFTRKESIQIYVRRKRKNDSVKNAIKNRHIFKKRERVEGAFFVIYNANVQETLPRKRKLYAENK